MIHFSDDLRQKKVCEAWLLVINIKYTLFPVPVFSPVSRHQATVIAAAAAAVALGKQSETQSFPSEIAPDGFTVICSALEIRIIHSVKHHKTNSIKLICNTNGDQTKIVILFVER